MPHLLSHVAVLCCYAALVSALSLPNLLQTSGGNTSLNLPLLAV